MKYILLFSLFISITPCLSGQSEDSTNALIIEFMAAEWLVSGSRFISKVQLLEKDSFSNIKFLITKDKSTIGAASKSGYEYEIIKFNKFGQFKISVLNKIRQECAVDLISITKGYWKIEGKKLRLYLDVAHWSYEKFRLHLIYAINKTAAGFELQLLERYRKK